MVKKSVCCLVQENTSGQWKLTVCNRGSQRSTLMCARKVISCIHFEHKQNTGVRRRQPMPVSPSSTHHWLEKSCCTQTWVDVIKNGDGRRDKKLIAGKLLLIICYRTSSTKPACLTLGSTVWICFDKSVADLSTFNHTAQKKVRSVRNSKLLFH